MKIWKSKTTGNYLTKQGQNVRVAFDFEVNMVKANGKKIKEI